MKFYISLKTLLLLYTVIQLSIRFHESSYKNQNRIESFRDEQRTRVLKWTKGELDGSRYGFDEGEWTSQEGCGHSKS